MIPNNPGKSQDRNFSVVVGLALLSFIIGEIAAVMNDLYIYFGMFLSLAGCIAYVILLDDPNPDTIFPSGSEYYINNDLGDTK